MLTPTRLLVAALVLALGWGGAWAVGAWTAKRALVAWMEDRRADGWQAEWSDISLRGFPNRFDRTIQDLVLADPDSGWAWEAPFFQILGLSYDPKRLILIWPPEQRLLTPDQKITLKGDELRASLTLGAGENDPLDHAALVFRGLGLQSDAGWRLTAREARIGLRKTTGRAGWMDVGVEAVGLAPPNRAIQALSRAEVAPKTLDRLTADLAIELAGPLDRTALETERPGFKRIEIREIRAVWGDLDLAIAGDLTVDDSGLPRGDIQIKARNWPDMLRVAQETGLLPKALAGPLTQALDLLSGLAGRPDTLDIPLQFRSGRTWLGPVPIGSAPRLVLP